jgi:subtilisin-like proprotein convertase family protein
MRSSLRFWLAVSLLLVAGAIVIWWKERPEKSAAPVAWAQPQSTTPRISALMTTPSVLAATGASAPKKNESTASLRARYQLSNVEQPLEAWTRIGTAILMKNALIDTRQPVELNIPAELRAGKNPGAYIVQADRSPTKDFQQTLKDAGAEIVAYVPNNAFLVKAEAATAGNLEKLAGVRAVLAYEPYYKLDTRLMKFAVDHETMADDAWLRVTLFPGASETALASLANAIGVKEKSPFGEQILVQPRAGTLASFAQLPEVQIVEPWTPRVAANDLTRVTLGVAEDTKAAGNYLGLSGANEWVNLNDIGVDASHPALQGRVFFEGTNGNVDFDGHGTHVAASIAGNKATSIFDHLDAIPDGSTRTNYVVTTDEDGNSTTNFFIDGSLTNADFRGIAYNAKLFVLPIDYTPDVNQPVTDSYLIETAARTNYYKLKRTNETLISNNSWNYANNAEYDSQAARFDAATRDALPEDTASQPVLYVFAAGNEGFGGEDGLGGEPGSIASPGTAKNVITVGALESPRFIAEALTNIEERVEIDDEGQPQTNKVTNLVQIFRASTDSANEIASFSSRGNVGIGIEGASGRFKPDLVAPGTFIMSARSTNWNLTNDFNPADPDILPMFNVLSNLNAVSSKYRYDSGTSFSAPGVSGLLSLIQEFFSQKLPADRRRNLSPAMMKALLINSARSVNAVYDYDPRGTINYQGWGLVDLRNVLPLADTPTNQPARSILEALPEKQWPLVLIDQSPTNAVATGEERVWNIQVDTNALAQPLRFTLVWTDPPGNPQVGVKLVNDLDLTVEAGNQVFYGNDFVGGATQTSARDPWTREAIDNPSRDSVNNVEKIVIGDPQSLTDAQGKPVSSLVVRVSGRRVNVKAVNDYYDVTKRTNEIVQDFALVISADNSIVTNAFPALDRVKDVTVNTNVIVQTLFNGLEATNQRAGANSPLYWTNGNSVQWRFFVFTNNDRAITEGVAIPGLTAGRNVAFITSGPLNVGAPRNIEPDIDLYVSKDPLITNLNPAVLGDANKTWKSTTRLGTEQVVFAPDQFVHDKDDLPTTNLVQIYDPLHTDLGGVIVDQANVDDVFYIAVKSEDQQAGEFTLIAISSDKPFEEDRDGIRVIHMLPAPHDVPDGTPNLPQGRRYYGVPLRGGRILNSDVFFSVEHEELGDLVGTVGHGSVYATLNNHSLPNGFTNLLALVYSSSTYAPHDVTGHYYNDPNEYPANLYNPTIPPPGRPLLLQPDGPRDLSLFAGMRANPVWTLDMADSAAGHTGIVHQAEVHVTPLKPPLLNGQTIQGTVAANGQDFYPLDLPVDASKVTISLTIAGGANPNVLLLVRKDVVPATNNFDYEGTFTSGGSATVTISFDRNSQPPLIPGEYIVGVVNSGNTPVNYTLTVTIETDSSGAFRAELGDSFIPLKDDAKTVSEADYSLDRVVTDATVAILSENARVSDLVLRLTSPQGTSVILSENRGFFDTNGFGSVRASTNGAGDIFQNSYAVFTDDLGSPIKFTLPPFGDSASTRGFIFGNSFEKAVEGTYTVGQIFDGWRVDTNTVYVLFGDAADSEMYANLGDRGAISQTLPTVKGRPYKLSFSYRGKPKFTRVDFGRTNDWMSLPSVGPVFSTGQVQSDDGLSHTNAPMGTVDRHWRIVNNPDPFYPPLPGQDGSTLWIANTNTLPFPAWFANDTNSQWLALQPQNDNNHPAGRYTNRTSFIITENPTLVRVNARVAVDESPPLVLVNGTPVTVLWIGGDKNGYSNPFTIASGFQTGLNTIDFVENNAAVGPVGFRAQMAMTLVTKGATNASQVVTNEQTVGYMKLSSSTTNRVASVTGTAEWQTFEVEFIADEANMKLQFFAAKPLQGSGFSGVDIDNIVLEDTGTVYLNPEEPLSMLEGERAMGEWKLEAIDNRTGAVVPAVIDDWKLMLGTANPTRFAEPLAAGRVYPSVINNPVIRANTNVYTPGRILDGETEWFYFDVCDSSTFATVFLFAPSSNTIPVELMVDRSGFPTGNPETDDYTILRTTPGTKSTVTLPLTLTSPIAAPLQAGKRLFIAVRGGQFAGDTNQTFQIRILPNGCAFTAPQLLPAGVAVSSVAFAASPGDDGTTYQATTTAPSSIEIAADGALTLLASNGSEPTATNYQLKQTVSTGKATLALPSAGTWYFRVINESNTTAPYTLTVGAQSSGVRSVSIAGDHLQVTWDSVPGTSYEIATSTDLSNWTPVTTVQATSAETTYTDPAAVGGMTRFIRIRPL